MSIETSIAEALRTAAAQCGVVVDYVPLEHPEHMQHGDFASSLALAHAKKMGKNPRELAQEIAAHVADPHIARVEVAGPGFINITCAPHVFYDALQEAYNAGDAWGTSIDALHQEVVLEYTDPNPFKAFHIGHLMSNAIGESLARLLESQGMVVRRANYQGDVGIHIACAIWGIQQLGIDPNDAQRLGEAYAYGATRYKNAEKNESWNGVKAEIDTLNRVIYEQTDTHINEIYRVGRAASLALFDELYALLGTKFDHYFFESELADKGKEIVLAHPQTFEDSEGAKVFRGEKVGLHTRVFLTAKGIPVYETKELALAYEKERLYPRARAFLVVTANEITEYYKVIIAAMNEIDAALAAKMQHIPHGMMKLPSGKMSSRTGKVVTGQSLIDDLIVAAKARAQESRAEDRDALARDIAVAAVKFQVLRQGMGKDSVFEQEKALSLEGDSGPYVQYAYARCCSLLRKGGESSIVPFFDATQSVGDLERMLVRFPHVVARAARELQPQYVAHYALDIASRFNAWYAHTKVLGVPESAHRLACVAVVAHTLKNALSILGIRAPETM